MLRDIIEEVQAHFGIVNFPCVVIFYIVLSQDDRYNDDDYTVLATVPSIGGERKEIK